MKRRTFLMAAGAVSSSAVWPVSASRASASRVLRFGQSASLTGSQSVYGRDVQTGIAAAFAAANAAEATTGVRFELTSLDDGGARNKCIANATQLLDSGVTALIGLTHGVAAESCVSMADQAQMAMLGTASGNMGLRTPGAHSVFHVRAGYDAEFKRMANYLHDVGLQKVALVRLADTAPANLEAMNAALSSVSISPKVAIAIDRAATNFDSVTAELMAAKPDCVLFVANAGPVASMIDQMTKAKYPGLFYASSYAGQDLIDTLASRHQSCVMSMVVPRPSQQGVNVVAQCRRDLALLDSGARVGITTLEGYIAGRTAVDAAMAAVKAGNVTRGRMKESLAALRSDLGGYKVEFAGTSQGSRYVDLVTLDKYGRLVG
jgi:ABC-type branched-subunit amino acid transport system substrate-binding protein